VQVPSPERRKSESIVAVICTFRRVASVRQLPNHPVAGNGPKHPTAAKSRLNAPLLQYPDIFRMAHDNRNENKT